MLSGSVPFSQTVFKPFFFAEDAEHTEKGGNLSHCSGRIHAGCAEMNPRSEHQGERYVHDPACHGADPA